MGAVVNAAASSSKIADDELVQKVIENVLSKYKIPIVKAMEEIPTFKRMRTYRINYVYPRWHTVSFTLVAKEHIKHMKALMAKIAPFEVSEIDERAFVGFYPSVKLPTFVHPAFYVMNNMYQLRFGGFDSFKEKYYAMWKNKFHKLIAIEVADSDRISEKAAEIVNRMDEVIVPSTFSKEAFEKSGVKYQ